MCTMIFCWPGGYMDFSVGLILSIAALIIFTLQIWKWTIFRTSSKRQSSAPQAGGAWPVIGHLHLFGGKRLPNILLADLADKHGPAFIIRLGLKPTLVVSSWQLAKELCTTNDIAVSSRPKLLVAKHLGYDYAMFPFNPDFAYWREMRKLVSMHLFSPRRLEVLKHVQVSELDASMKDLYKLWKEKKDTIRLSGRVAVDLKQWFHDLSLNVILRMVAGKRCVATAGDETQEKEAKKYQKVTGDIMHLIGAFVVADCLPFLRWFDIGGYEKKMKKTALEMDEIMEGWLKDHRRKRSESKSVGDEDFMDVMLSSVMEENAFFTAFDADRITKSTCMTMISSGTDTTAIMLTWAATLLSNNGHVLKEAHKEMDNIVGKERRVKESDIPNLPYLQAIIKEVLRLDLAGSLSIREFSKHCIVGGYYIPKGTRLIINLWKLQRDPTVWEHPSEFRPERFLTLHKDLDVKGQHFQLIPFGAGRRICPAMNFGLQMMHLVLANFIQAFDFSTPYGMPVDMTAKAGMGNMKATPLHLLISPRLPSNLY